MTGNVLGVVVVARDITEQKRIEKELMEAKVFAELATGLPKKQKVKRKGYTNSWGCSKGEAAVFIQHESWNPDPYECHYRIYKSDVENRTCQPSKKNI